MTERSTAHDKTYIAEGQRVSLIPCFKRRDRAAKLRQWYEENNRPVPLFLITKPCVYVLLLNTGKHYYVGSTSCLLERLRQHARGDFGARATKTYGFTNQPANLIHYIECETRDEAYILEHQIATKWRHEQPDTPICGDYYSFGTFNSDQYE